MKYIAGVWYAGEQPNENTQHDFNESKIKNKQDRHIAISDKLQPRLALLQRLRSKKA